MNKIFSLLFFTACGFLVLLHLACNNSTSTSAAAATPTPVGSSATVNATSGDVFSPSSVTITHGGAVTFAETGGSHTLVIDNGSGTCVQNFTTWPQVVTFAAAGTYSFHCTIHSSCMTTTTCTGCTGMVGQVIVQ